MEKEIIWETKIQHNGKHFHLFCNSIENGPEEPIFKVEAVEVNGKWDAHEKCTAEGFELTVFKLISAAIKYAEKPLPPTSGGLLFSFPKFQLSVKAYFKRLIKRIIP